MSNQSVNVRQSFIPRPGYYFMDFDYEQIEFRLSAAMAGEKHLVQGFADGNDYYTMIYDAMFGTTYKVKSAISATNRKIGKEISLGQNYGQEAGGLSRKMKVTYEKAKELMDQYWNGLPATRLAKEQSLQFALKNGHVQTWFGRIRPLPDLYSDIRPVKAKATRSVWNTIVQGTALDWLKIAMNRAFRGLQGRDAHLLLTVHDELVAEVSEKEPFHEIKKILLEAMEYKVKGLPVNMLDRYPDGYSVKVGTSYCYDWGHPLEEDEFLQQYGDRINLTAVRPDVVYSFLSDPQPITVPVISGRARNIAGKTEEEELVASTVVGVHPIDELIDVVRKQRGLPPLTPPVEPMVHAGTVKPDPVSAEPEVKVIRTEVSPAMVAAVEGAMGNLPPPPSLSKPVFEAIQTAAAIVGRGPTEQEIPALAKVNGEKPRSIEEVVVVKDTRPTAETDFVYPCVLFTIPGDLTKKEIDLMKVVLAKYPGDYWLYLSYKDRLTKMGPSYKCNPDAAMQGYMKRVLGKDAQIEVFDAKGKSARGRVQFA